MGSLTNNKNKRFKPLIILIQQYLSNAIADGKL